MCGQANHIFHEQRPPLHQGQRPAREGSQQAARVTLACSPDGKVGGPAEEPASTKETERKRDMHSSREQQRAGIKLRETKLSDSCSSVNGGPTGPGLRKSLSPAHCLGAGHLNSQPIQGQGVSFLHQHNRKLTATKPLYPARRPLAMPALKTTVPVQGPHGTSAPQEQ